MKELMYGALVGAIAAIIALAIADEIDAGAGACTASGGDGDSFICGPNVIRVLGIDTPEAFTWINSQGITRDPECFGVKAMKARKALTSLGPVTLTGTLTDGHGRLLRYVTLADGRDLGAVLIASGHAALFKGVDNGEPDYLLYAPAQIIAQATGAGMWGACNNPPGHNGRVVP